MRTQSTTQKSVYKYYFVTCQTPGRTETLLQGHKFNPCTNASEWCKLYLTCPSHHNFINFVKCVPLPLEDARNNTALCKADRKLEPIFWLCGILPDFVTPVFICLLSSVPFRSVDNSKFGCNL